MTVNVEGVGQITGDIAWGGNWFFLVDAAQLPKVEGRGLRVEGQQQAGSRTTTVAVVEQSAIRIPHSAFSLADVEQLTNIAWQIRQALERNGITGEDSGVIDHIELFGPPGDAANHGRNFVLCPGRAYDRSPCGTGTSAKLACLYADGKLKPGEVWRQESILGSVFEGSVRLDGDRLIPRVTGTAYITAEAMLLLDPADPFQMGIRV
ncbi:MAG: proline racemase family protein [Candidatus Saccharimonas sp.]|nr:proline racemase family protein [Planctomycetaceae bacterium]